MTHTAIEELIRFLDQFVQKSHVPIGDFGGTEELGGHIVRDILVRNGVPANNYYYLDWENGVDLLKPVRGRKFRTGICMDLLEHVSNPFIVGENITNALLPKAYLFVTAPWVWEYHGCPNDYWRISADALPLIFPKLELLRVYEVNDTLDASLRKRSVGIFRKRTTMGI